MNFLLLLTSLLLLNPSVKGEQQGEQQKVLLLRTSNDAPNESHKIGELWLQISVQDKVMGLIKKQFNKKTNEIIKESFYPLDELTKGAVIEQKKGRDIISLRVDRGFKKDRTKVELRYLKNGIIGEYAEQYLYVIKTNNKWSVRDGEGKNIEHLHIVGNKLLLIGSIGIEYIQFKEKRHPL